MYMYRAECTTAIDTYYAAQFAYHTAIVHARRIAYWRTAWQDTPWTNNSITRFTFVANHRRHAQSTVYHRPTSTTIVNMQICLFACWTIRRTTRAANIFCTYKNWGPTLCTKRHRMYFSSPNTTTMDKMPVEIASIEYNVTGVEMKSNEICELTLSRRTWSFLDMFCLSRNKDECVCVSVNKLR